MTRATYDREDLALTLPIDDAVCSIAQLFATQQTTTQKAEQVRRNTLAVLVVNDYLHMLGINTDLNSSDSWNPVVRVCTDTADLVLPGVGRLECRPVGISENVCFIPPETWEERVGYVVVQIDESLSEAKVLGFVQTAATMELSLSQLQPLEKLIEHLAQLMQPAVSQEVNLGQWFAGIFETGWQSLESLWNQPELRPAYAFRRGETEENDDSPQLEGVTRRAKLIDLGIQIANQPVMLIVQITPEADQKTSVRLQLHPTGNEIYLTAGVQLTVLDQSGMVFLEVEARSADNYIQLQFRGETAEQFSVKVALNDASVIEHFVI